jgi:hypothetical protein
MISIRTKLLLALALAGCGAHSHNDQLEATTASSLCTSLLRPGGNISQWAHVDATGKLVYGTLPPGDHIVDFSSAGYRGGGIAIPTAPVVETLHPSGGDDTPAIQAALDRTAKRPLTNGLRGAVLLAPGTFTLDGSLTLDASGVVLRGSGSGAGGTLIKLTGTPRTGFTIGGSGSWSLNGAKAAITDRYVPSGAISFHVDNPSPLSVGATVMVQRIVTAEWVHFMGMDMLMRHGMPQTWLKPGTVLSSDRVIKAISGNQVTLDVPLTDAIDALLSPGATVASYTFPGRTSELGIEHLHVVAPPMTAAISQATYKLLDMNATIDSWIEDVAGEGFINGLSIGGTAKQITIEDSSLLHTAPIDGSSGFPADYSLAGSQILLHRSTSTGEHVFSVVTQAETAGPNVVLNFTANGTPTNLAPHQRWATGLLLDGIQSPTGGIDLQNRGDAGSGQGWAIGFGVVWNSIAGNLLIEKPPGSQNWAIGSSGTLDSGTTGVIDSPGALVNPKSLYLAQLCERSGAQALVNIGY